MKTLETMLAELPSTVTFSLSNGHSLSDGNCLCILEEKWRGRVTKTTGVGTTPTEAIAAAIEKMEA